MRIQKHVSIKQEKFFSPSIFAFFSKKLGWKKNVWGAFDKTYISKDGYKATSYHDLTVTDSRCYLAYSLTLQSPNGQRISFFVKKVEK